MSASEYGFQIDAGLLTGPYFEFADARVAEEVLETAEQVLEHYDVNGTDPYNREENVIEFEARPEYVRAVRDAVEILQNGGEIEPAELLDGGERL